MDLASCSIGSLGDQNLAGRFVPTLSTGGVVARERCPSCGKLTVLPVIYGMPLPEDFDTADVIFAGCVIPAFVLDEPVECESESCTWSGGTLDGQRVGSVDLGVANFLYEQELLIHFSDPREGDHMVPVEDLERMTIEITLGWSWGDPRTRVPDTPEHREKWERLAKQVADITARGYIVDLPGD